MKRYKLTWGIVLLVVGSLLLLDNLNVFAFLGVSIWKLIWPMGLIAMGIWVLWLSMGDHDTGEVQEISVPVDIAEAYTVNLKYGAGELIIGSELESESLLQCTSQGGLLHHIDDTVDSKKITLSSPAHIKPFRFINNRKWDVTLNGSIPCDLVLSTGACETRVDLTHTLVQSLRLDTGASSTHIMLPSQAGMTKVSGSGGAASLTVVVPPEVAARITVKGGIYSANVDKNRFPRNGNYYQSPDYETALNKVDMKLDMGVGSIEVR